MKWWRGRGRGKQTGVAGRGRGGQRKKRRQARRWWMRMLGIEPSHRGRHPWQRGGAVARARCGAGGED